MGHDVPGGASRMAIPVRGRCRFTARMIGGDIGWPIWSRPSTNCMGPEAPRATSPIARGISRMAFSGQTKAQPPQPQHNSGNVSTAFPRQTIAWGWQNSPQRPHRVQRTSSTSGTGMVTASRLVMTGFRKMCPLGASTSQSR